jgi:hypothetical protein
MNDHARPDDPGASAIDQGAPPVGRPYETPRLIRYGHVKTLTAGTKLGVNDISLNSSIV